MSPAERDPVKQGGEIYPIPDISIGIPVPASSSLQKAFVTNGE